VRVVSAGPATLRRCSPEDILSKKRGENGENEDVLVYSKENRIGYEG